MLLSQANPKDSDAIFSAIDWRVQQLKMQDHKEAEVKVTELQQTAASSSSPSQHSSQSTTSRKTTDKKRPTEDADDTAPTKKARSLFTYLQPTTYRA